MKGKKGKRVRRKTEERKKERKGKVMLCDLTIIFSKRLINITKSKKTQRHKQEKTQKFAPSCVF